MYREVRGRWVVEGREDQCVQTGARQVGCGGKGGSVCTERCEAGGLWREGRISVYRQVRGRWVVGGREDQCVQTGARQVGCGRG